MTGTATTAQDPFSHRELPLLTAGIPGSGGRVELLEDFVVEEIPAYLPVGEGEHCMVLVEKRGLTTPQAVQRLCEATGAASRDAGYAGLKDKHGVTRQWISLAGVDPTRLRRVQHDDLRVLDAGLHRNKLRTGHLKGNHFTVVLRGVHAEGLSRARAILDRLVREGLPNYFGEQRFGIKGDNARRGLALLRGEGGPRDRFKRRLLASALQSHVFNVVVARRLERDALSRLLGGEVLQRRDSGGVFISEAIAADGPRLEAGEIVITGPLIGPRMPWPKEGSPAHELERSIFSEHGLQPDQLARLGRVARGGRRPLTVEVHGASVEPLAQAASALRLRFSLPSGAYASVLLGEVAKGDALARP